MTVEEDKGEMAKNEIDCAKKTSYVIWNYSETTSEDWES
jgi:hypothetical protein